MRVRDDDGKLLPHARQWSELSVFFYAGMETTAHTIAWCAMRPHCQTALPYPGLQEHALTPSESWNFGCKDQPEARIMWLCGMDTEGSLVTCRDTNMLLLPWAWSSKGCRASNALLLPCVHAFKDQHREEAITVRY